MSRAMVDRPRAGPGGGGVAVIIGDFATARAEGTFPVAYLGCDTIMNPGGCVVVEVGVPDLRRLPPGRNAVPFRVGEGRLGFDLYDVAGRFVSSHHVTVRDGRGECQVIPFRYVWPAEPDLMARPAGVRPRARWNGWVREPFTGGSRQHVSVWEKAAD